MGCVTVVMSCCVTVSMSCCVTPIKLIWRINLVVYAGQLTSDR